MSWILILHTCFSKRQCRLPCHLAKRYSLNDDVDDEDCDDNAKTTSCNHNVLANNEFAPSLPIAVKIFMSWHVLSATLIKYSSNSVLSFNIGCERFVPFSFSLIWIPVLKNTIVFLYSTTLCSLHIMQLQGTCFHIWFISSNFRQCLLINWKNECKRWMCSKNWIESLQKAASEFAF